MYIYLFNYLYTFTLLGIILKLQLNYTYVAPTTFSQAFVDNAQNYKLLYAYVN
jgi:hypothetical protein